MKTGRSSFGLHDILAPKRFVLDAQGNMVSVRVIVESTDDAGIVHIDGYQRNVGMRQDANGMP